MSNAPVLTKTGRRRFQPTMATLEASPRRPGRARAAARARRRAAHRHAVGVGVRRHPLGRPRPVARRARARHGCSSRASRSARSRSRAARRCRRDATSRDRALRRALVRPLQRRAEPGRASVDAGTAAMLVNVGPILIARPRRRRSPRGLPARAARRLRDRVRGRRRDRHRDVGRRARAELGRRAVSRRGVSPMRAASSRRSRCSRACRRSR